MTATKRLPVASVLPARVVSVVDDATDPRDYVPISDLDAEGIVISAALNDFPTGCVPKLLAALRAEHFYSVANQRVWEAIETLHLEGKLCDPSSVSRLMRSRGTLQMVGGTKYLVEVLCDSQPSMLGWETHAAAVSELWRQRVLVEEMRRLEVQLRHGEIDHEGAKVALREHFQAVKV
jgi:replicative DNA helicase